VRPRRSCATPAGRRARPPATPRPAAPRDRRTGPDPAAHRPGGEADPLPAFAA
jgi:hypothetical protein